MEFYLVSGVSAITNKPLETCKKTFVRRRNITIKTHYETKVSIYKYGDSANFVQDFVLKLKVLYQHRIKDDKIIGKGHYSTTGYK